MNKKGNSNTTRILRIVLLFFTIILFLTFFYLFKSAYQQYGNIQQRTNKLLEISEKNQDRLDTLYHNFNDAEHHFRLFTINIDSKEYIAYKNNLRKLNSTIDSLIIDERNEMIYDEIGLIKKEEHHKVLNHYLGLRSMLNILISTSKNFKPLQIRSSTYVEGENDLEEDIHAHFKNNDYKDEILKTYSYNNLIKSLSILTKEERQLFAQNHSLLYKINNILRTLRLEQININKAVIKREKHNISAQSNDFGFQTFLCLIFMFALICVIIYYQFFTTYYRSELHKEKKYANKLADEKSDLFNEITHEIRTPINSLIGILDLLKKKENLYNEEDRFLVESAYTSIINTSKTIDDILNLNQKKPLVTTNQEFDIEDLLHTIIDIHQSEAKIKNIELTYILHKDTPTIIYTDEFKIKQILSNLISNAIKYSDQGKVICEIQIASFSFLKIKVIDKGSGIPVEMHQNLFKKYFTAGVDPKYNNGIGLGLFITKKFVDALKGNITFKSSSANGTTFNVEIPIPLAKYRTDELTKYQNIVDLPSTISLLIVDDNALNLLYLKQFFTKFISVRCANNGIEAIEIIKKYPIDLVITDINMPKMSGDELLVEVRSYKDFDRVKIIATSSDNEQVSTLENIHNCHFDAILTKPFNEKDLIRAIIKTLNLK